MKDPEKVKQGKQSKIQGVDFERRVRLDLEERGFVCDRWTNNIDFVENKIIPAKPAYSFNPKLKMRIPLSRNTGFPDYLCFRNQVTLDFYEIIGVECKMAGKLDKQEKEKCDWYLKNKIFSKIYVAKKIKIKNRIGIEYGEYKISKS